MNATIITFIFLLLAQFEGLSQTVTTLLRSGENANKLNLVIIGDGFQAGADQTTFNNYVDNTIMQQVFTEGPLWESMNAFNIFRINVNSVNSGVTQVDNNGNVTTARNTALGYRYSGNWNRCWMEPGPTSNATVNGILDTNIPNWTYVFIVLNEPNGGGCRRGNSLAVTLGSAWTTAAHEMGHMVGNLRDEYCRNGTYTGAEPVFVNLTIDTNRNTLKWRDFVRPTTPIPTGENARQGNGCAGFNQGTQPAWWSNSDDAGTFEGGVLNTNNAFDNGIYRPAVNCRMRGNTPPFCPVCYDQMKTSMDPFHEYTYSRSYVGDFTGDGLDDIVIHNDNSLALYRSGSAELEPIWIVTGEIPIWDDFRPGDRFFVGDFNNDNRDDLYVFNHSDWAFPYLGMLRSNGNGFTCVRLFELELPGWDDMRPHDQFFVGDFDDDGRDDLYVFNGEDWSMGYLEMLRSTGNNLAYVRRYDDNLPGWGEMRRNDLFYVGDFNNDDREDLYIFNGQDWSIGYLQMLRSAGNNLQHVRRYDEELPGWDDMRIHDKFYIADFNGDGRKDIYVFNGEDWSMEYLQMLRSTGNSLAYVRRFDGDVPGWNGLAPHDQFYVANIDGDSDEDLYVYNSVDWVTQYLGVLKSNGNNLSGSWQSDWIGSWNLGSPDRILVGDFAGSADWEDIFIRNNDWFGLLRSYQSSVGLTAIYPRWIHRHNYHRLGWW
ncbi:MAG: VCBS repeat-containing protein [Saprospiraceae bacterium]|nr:VCBS repeat-containing protein [Saprospiraceae bacterium]